MQIELKSVRGGSTATQMSTPLPPPPPHRPLPIRSPSRTSQPQPSLESPGWRGARHTIEHIGHQSHTRRPLLLLRSRLTRTLLMALRKPASKRLLLSCPVHSVGRFSASRQSRRVRTSRGRAAQPAPQNAHAPQQALVRTARMNLWSRVSHPHEEAHVSMAQVRRLQRLRPAACVPEDHGARGQHVRQRARGHMQHSPHVAPVAADFGQQRGTSG
mmetsp:Transcript_26996/g.81716  ORF Transcript_26996/g.81716 Transcript_26996/m.81716 type:complete len:215 (+) Transcript_26996:2006-2650(+)